MTTNTGITCSILDTGTEQFVTVFVPGNAPLSAGQDHPNFTEIVEAAKDSLLGKPVDAERLIGLFDAAEAVRQGFKRLSERVTVENGEVRFDGDPVSGPLQAQILDFVKKGEDFGPLVKLYENLTTNPLGDVREGIFTWIESNSSQGGGFAITPDGSILGYKSVHTRDPEWRTDEETVYVPSRRGAGRVNDREVSTNEYIEQVPGDVVEMPRSKVLHAPSQACGDGLHIGTYQYAQSFQGDTVLLVKFNPRDVVSVPDSNATWKLRVCRYTVVGVADEPVDVPLYITDDVRDEAAEAIDAATGDANSTDLILA